MVATSCHAITPKPIIYGSVAVRLVWIPRVVVAVGGDFGFEAEVRNAEKCKST